MPISIVMKSNLYSADVSPPHGDWKSTHPMPPRELQQSLLAAGCSSDDVLHAFLNAPHQIPFPVRMIKQDTLYSAEVTLPDGVWKSSLPMPATELWKALEAIGCRDSEITVAFDKVGLFPSYEQMVEELKPQILSAIAGEREVPPQSAFSEAWLTYALYEMDKYLTIQTLIEDADSLNHAIPSADEVSWAFLQLGRRGWLLVEGDTYALTVEARDVINNAARGADVWDRMKRLEEWITAHPPGMESPRKRRLWLRERP